jgi:5-hydroxyisourate hydrolase-like protein (transthyretin family)
VRARTTVATAGQVGRGVNRLDSASHVPLLLAPYSMTMYRGS